MSSVPDALGGRFQDFEFAVPEVVGMTVVALVVDFFDGVRVESTNGSSAITRYIAEDGALFFLKPSGRHWQRFFLDAGAGFLGEFDEAHEYAEILEEIREPSCLDLGVRHGLVGATIASLICGEREDVGGTSFTISFVDGREVVYYSSKATVLDSPVVVDIKPAVRS